MGKILLINEINVVKAKSFNQKIQVHSFSGAFRGVCNFYSKEIKVTSGIFMVFVSAVHCLMLILLRSLFAYCTSLDNGVKMNPKRRAILNLSWFFLCICCSKSLLIKWDITWNSMRKDWLTF